MIYIASPYTHTSPDIRRYRFEQVERYTAQLTREGKICFSPIVYAHAMAERHNLPFDAKYWFAFNTHQLRHASCIHTLCLQGWEISDGVENERYIAAALNLPEELIEWPV